MEVGEVVRPKDNFIDLSAGISKLSLLGFI